MLLLFVLTKRRCAPQKTKEGNKMKKIIGLLVMVLVLAVCSPVLATDFSVLLGTWNLTTKGMAFGEEIEGHPIWTFTDTTADSAIGYNHLNDTVLATWDGIRGQFRVSTVGNDLVFYVTVMGDRMVGETDSTSLLGLWTVEGTKEGASCPTDTTTFDLQTLILTMPSVCINGQTYNNIKLRLNLDGTWEVITE
jgi:hypothetical protein